MMHAIRTSVVVALLIVMAVPALADPPEVFPPESADSSDVLDPLFCGFAVGVEIEGKAGAIVFDDRAILSAPGMEAHLTNLDTGKGVSLKIQGTLHDTFLDEEGDHIRTLNVGRNLLFGFFDGDPGIFLTIGKIVTESVLSVFPWQFDVIESESPGKMIDVCAMLSG
jgi:hypothetical protein